ncbi:hypothetical protein [Candidatus Accumulibacter contiguus]|uniref:hypothetical protein n=1 Tax=Candidatus Accumulibacter contiguus TaxID=2954381 RepID=UPI00145F705B|nr:hypothetical protein [Candidatus Accumulibacter contiguus]
MRSLVLSLFMMVCSALSFANDNPTKDDAKALVKEAVQFVKQNGREKFFNEVRSPNGKFHFKEGTKKRPVYFCLR